MHTKDARCSAGAKQIIQTIEVDNINLVFSVNHSPLALSSKSSSVSGNHVYIHLTSKGRGMDRSRVGKQSTLVQTRGATPFLHASMPGAGTLS
eukprot:1158743-Pelagomonas_calceolata.AAC.15